MRDLNWDLKANIKSILALTLFVYKLMIGSSKNNRENYLRKRFQTQEKETRVKFNPGLNPNRPLNNWAVSYKTKIVSTTQPERMAWSINPTVFYKPKNANKNTACEIAINTFLLYFWLRRLRQLFFAKFRFVWWWCCVGLQWSLFNM